MAAAKIRKGDQVVVLSGKDKGKHGEVTKAMPKDGKVIVAGVNVITRHRKPSQANPQGGLERTEGSFQLSRIRIPGRDEPVSPPSSEPHQPRTEGRDPDRQGPTRDRREHHRLGHEVDSAEAGLGHEEELHAAVRRRRSEEERRLHRQVRGGVPGDGDRLRAAG